MQTITLRVCCAIHGLMTLVVVIGMAVVLPTYARAAQGWVRSELPAIAPLKVAGAVPRHYVPLPAGAQQLGGLLGERFRTNLEGRLLHVDEAGLLDGFEHRPGKHEWIGEHIGKFLDAASRVYRYNKDARLKLLMDRMAKTLIATQEDDGYLGTYAKPERWTSWDVWVHKYDLMGLLAYHQATGDAGALAAAVKVGNLLVNTFGTGKRDLIAAGTHVGMAATSVLHPMVDLYRTTGDVRYLEFCRYILKAYDQPNGPGIVTTLAKTGSVRKTANNKAYEMISNLIGLLKLYEVTADKQLLNVALAAWKDIAQNRLYLTGSASSKEHFQEAQVLPAEVKDNIAETCVTVNWLEFNVQLLGLLAEARFADEIEKTVMNHLLGAQDAKNGNFAYYTPLNGAKPYTPGINCCVSSGPRGISMLPELAWGQLDGAPAVTLYTAGRAKHTLVTVQGPIEVELQARTDFPRTGNITFNLRASRVARFAVFLRVPAWTTKFEVSGEREVGMPGTFMRVERTWQLNNKFDVKMDLPVRTVEGGKSYEGRVAIMRGPQVLAMDLGDTNGNPAPGLREFVALQGPLPALPLSPLPKRNSLAWSTPALIETEQGATKSTITLVPFADARVPQVWLWKENIAPELVASRKAYEVSRRHILAPRTKVAPIIDGSPDVAVFKRKTPMAMRVGPGNQRSQASFDVAWDTKFLYVAAWVSDPTPEQRTDANQTDNISVGVSRVGYEASLANSESFAQVLFRSSPCKEGISRATATTSEGYTTELAIPWGLLKTRPQPGGHVAFEIRNHDQGVKGINDDGDWQWAGNAPEGELPGLLDLTQ